MNAITHAQDTRASAEDWLRFLRPLAAAVRNPPTEADCKIRAVACASTLDTPRAMVTDPWWQRQAAAKFVFWPAVADIGALFEPELERVEAERERVKIADLARRMTRRLEAPAPVSDIINPEQRAAIVAKARERAAELRAAGGDRRPEKVTARLLSPDDLAARYRVLAEEGNRLAATRLRTLEPEA